MTNKVKHYIIWLFCAILTFIPASAQHLNIRVANQVIQGQRFTLSISVTDGDAEITRENAPKLKDCTLIAGPGISTMQSVQIINGRQSSSVTKEYAFTYTADKAGTVNIPAITVKVNGREMQTQPKTLTVLPPDQANQRRRYNHSYPSSIDEMEEWMHEIMNGGDSDRNPTPVPSRDSKISPNDFLVTVNLSKSDIYEKEAVIATIKLYTKHDVTKFQPLVMPQFEGFLSEELDVSNQQAQQEHFRGENYYSLILKKCLLYPQKSGKLTINSGTYDVTLQTVEYVSNGYYATPVARSHNITTTSNSVSINVKPLPSPVPASFSGAVGHFEVTSQLVPQQLRTNEAAKYILTVKGIGNIKHLAEPIVPLPANVEEYTPTGESDARFNGSNMQGTYTATYTFVPQSVGKLDIPSWDYTYFDPSTGKYVTVTLPAYECVVAKGIASGASSQTVGKVDTGSIRDIRHITNVDESNLRMHPSPLFHKIWYPFMYLLALAVLIVAAIVYRRQIKMAADVQGQKIRKAKSVAAKRLNKARVAMSEHNSDAFFAAVSSALWGFISDKLKMPASSLTRDNIADTLSNAGADEKLISDTIGLLDECEMARFTPVHSETELSSIYASATSVIDNLNRIKVADKTKKVETKQSRYGI